MLLALILSLAFLGLLVLGGWVADKVLGQPTEQWAARTAQAWQADEPAVPVPAPGRVELRQTSRGARGARSRPRAVRVSG